jgi:hypothetical protein
VRAIAGGALPKAILRLADASGETLRSLTISGGELEIVLEGELADPARATALLDGAAEIARIA